MSRLLFVVQRYGEAVLGGAEAACRGYAEQLAARGHDITVVTSCALDYADWHDHFPPGVSTINGVRVRRLPVVQPRRPEHFTPLHELLMTRSAPVPLAFQHRWSVQIGPDLRGLAEALGEEATGRDAAIVFTYLYAPTAVSLAVLPSMLPTVVIPFAHDEAYLHLPVFQGRLRAAHARGYMTAEEATLVDGMFGTAPSQVLGIGFEGSTTMLGPLPKSVRGQGPYLLSLGRVDRHKGSFELLDMFAAFRERHPGSDLRLVVAGDDSPSWQALDGGVSLGFIDEATKQALLNGCLALVQPSYVESFSMVLCETWQHGRPVLVQGRSDVLRGQAIRSRGGLFYEGYPEFEACVEELLGSPDLGAALGESGRRYVAQTYSWDAVLERLAVLVEQASRERLRSQARATTA